MGIRSPSMSSTLSNRFSLSEFPSTRIASIVPTQPVKPSRHLNRTAKSYPCYFPSVTFSTKSLSQLNPRPNSSSVPHQLIETRNFVHLSRLCHAAYLPFHQHYHEAQSITCPRQALITTSMSLSRMLTTAILEPLQGYNMPSTASNYYPSQALLNNHTHLVKIVPLES